MTQTIYRPGLNGDENEEFTPNGGRVPRLSGDIRHLIPKLGLREYWFPLCGVNRVKKNKPMRVRMLGEDLCVFRGASKGEIHALTDICPHRGARLSEGDCHYAGTVSCPYHGWTFDGKGTNVAVLSEGPNSQVCGKPGTEARAYPTQVLKGVVFVWMGDAEPAPIEEDVPEEFFNPQAYILFNDRIYWKTNWEVALENSMDAHVQYLHRDNLSALLASNGIRIGAPIPGARPVFTGNGFNGESTPPPPPSGDGGDAYRQQAELQATQNKRQTSLFNVWPNGWRWPKHRYRTRWSWLGAPFFNLMQVASGPIKQSQLWGGGHHLPGLHRFAGQPARGPRTNPLVKLFTPGGSGLFGLYPRHTVPVDEWLTRTWYYHYMVPSNSLQKAWIWFNYVTWGRWSSEYNFSQQDMSVMLHQIYDASEKLSGTDAEVVQWRKLVVTKHFGGRDYPFEYERQERAEALSAPSSAVSNGNGLQRKNGDL